MTLISTKLKLRFITIAVNEEFFTVVRKGMKDAAAAMQLEAELVGTPGVSAADLIELTRQAIGYRMLQLLALPTESLDDAQLQQGLNELARA